MVGTRPKVHSRAELLGRLEDYLQNFWRSVSVDGRIEANSRVAANEQICYNRCGHHVNGSEYDRQKLKEYKGVHLKDVITINRRGLAAMTSFFLSLCILPLANTMSYISMRKGMRLCAGFRSYLESEL